MSRKHLVVAAFVATFVPTFSAAPAAYAQDAVTKLSGTWTGYIGRSEASPSPVKAELTFASNGSLTGTITGPQLTPGTISTGTYDRATGVLTFTVVLRDAANSQGGNVQFDGRISSDPAERNALTASGKMVLNGETGVFKFVHPSSIVSVVPVTREVDRHVVNIAELKRAFVQTYDWVARAAELVPAERYSYKPVATVRTFGQQVAHIVDGARYYCGRGTGKDVPWTDATEKGVAAKGAIVAALKTAVAECSAAYDSGTQVGPLVENISHASLHYGNVVTYMRMLGLTPPSS